MLSSAIFASKPIPMDSKLSAAEIKTLQSPETEQVKIILPLILKELVLLGWVAVRKGRRPVNSLQWGLLAILIIGIGVVNILVGLIGVLILLVFFYKAMEPKTLLSVTPLGEQKLRYFGPNSPLLVRALHTVAFARPADYEDCTHKEWRGHLSKEYPDNATFHANFLLFSLENRGLVKWKQGVAAKRTPAGDAALAQAETEIQRGYELPRLLRDDATKAAVLAASLGGLVLLVPDMEGYYYSLFNTVGFPEADLEDRRRKDTGSSLGGGGGVSYSGDPDPSKEDDQDTENGMDWGDNADFLDGDVGDDSGDSGIGTDSGCGVGSDSSDGGGDSGGDGGGDGGCSGCGGCGGGGD